MIEYLKRRKKQKFSNFFPLFKKGKKKQYRSWISFSFFVKGMQVHQRDAF
jgi:hypothetical protein